MKIEMTRDEAQSIQDMLDYISPRLRDDNVMELEILLEQILED